MEEFEELNGNDCPYKGLRKYNSENSIFQPSVENPALKQPFAQIEEHAA